MTITASNDSFTYKSPRNDIERPADLVGVVNPNGSAIGSQPYPTGQTALSNGSANMANQAAVATLTGAALTTVYLAGFEVHGAGATAGLAVGVTVAGLLGGTRTYAYVFETGVAVGNNPIVVAFDPPLPAAAVNTAIVVTCPASGAGGTANTVNAHGFHL